MNIRDYVGEGTEYEKKEALEERRPKSWLKSVSAFANGQGGVLLFGISDNDELVGLKDAEKVAENISEIIKNRMDPIPDIGMSIRREIVDNQIRKFVVLQIYSGKETPYYYTGDGLHTAYVRIGNESVQAQAIDLKRLVLAGTSRTWDSLSSPYEAKKFTFGRLYSAYLKRSGRTLQDKDFASFGLIDENGFLTNAGVLFADDSPIRHSRVFCTRWQGLDKASRVVDATNDRELEGSIVSLFMDTMDFIGIHNQKRWKKLPTMRMEMPDYPERAAQECLINALVHRDYLVLGSEVHVDIYDNRMEITSPGGMLSRKVVQNLDLMSVPSLRRNPVVADVFGRMDYMERRGSGFKKVYDEYQREICYREDKAPVFYSESDYFRVTLFNLNYGVSVEAQNEMLKSRVKGGINDVGINDFVENQTDVVENQTNVVENQTDVVESQTNVVENQTNVVEIVISKLIESPNISASELALLVHKSQRQMQRILSMLKANGIIRRIGPDKGGHWEICENGDTNK